MSSSSPSSGTRIMVFRPTMEDMKDFSKFIQHIESKGAHKAGLAKIIPPAEWRPRRRPYSDSDVNNLVIPAPIQQEVHGNSGLYQQYNMERKRMTVGEFRKLAESPRYATPPHFDYEELERKYWKNISFNPPIYGADVSGTIYDKDVDDFNVARLNTILDLIGEDYGVKIEGVNTAYLYFGMWKSSFAWHTEDMDLYSINYLHHGAPKSWYAIPPEHGKRLERLAAGFFPKLAKLCPAFLRHKMTIISPALLKNFSIPYDKITQEQGEFMITFPYGYHAGYNQGFNIAESTNFALPRWIEYGKRSRQCHCRKDNVHISMDRFVAKFQPDRYELWKAGKDMGCHPEDPTRVYAAPLPVARVPQADGKSKRIPAAALVSRRLPVAECDEYERQEEVQVGANGTVKKRPSNGGSSKNKKTRTDNSVRVMKKHCQPLFIPVERVETDVEIAVAVGQTVDKLLFNVVTSKLNSKRKLKNLPDWVLQHGPLFVTKSSGQMLKKDDLLLARQNYHKQLCSLPPHCACCVPFMSSVQLLTDSLLRSTVDGNESSSSSEDEVSESEVLIPPAAFSQHGNRLGVATPVLMDAQEASELVKCVRCYLRVHKSCYGVSSTVGSTWVCDACNHEQLNEAFQSRRLAEPTCTLCSMRGGALKKTSDGRWAHILCAVLIPDVYFENTEEKCSIETKQVTKARKKLTCYMCKDLPMDMANKGVCIQCFCGRSMHVTCSIASGTVLDIGNWPEPVYARCYQHRQRRFKDGEAANASASPGDEVKLEIGSNVYAKHKNTRYYAAILQKTFKHTYYSVHFHDGSATHDLSLQFIFVKGPKGSEEEWVPVTSETMPSLSEEVQVLWNDGQTYKGLYAGSSEVQMCTVLFEDESTMTMLRKFVFSEDETLPKKILAKLSFASDQVHPDFLSTAPVATEKSQAAAKRKRTSNSRYEIALYE